MANLENWISLFRDKQDQKNYDFIFQTLVTNQLISRLQLKLLTSEQLDYMFSEDLALGAKALLVYLLDLLKDESPLPTEKIVPYNKISLRYLKLGVYLSCVLTAKKSL